MQIPEVGENSVLIFLTTSVDTAVGVMGMKGRTPFNLMLPSRVGESHFNISQSSASPEFCFFFLGCYFVLCSFYPNSASRIGTVY
jgi:hypothetical protein